MLRIAIFNVRAYGSMRDLVGVFRRLNANAFVA